MTRPAVFLDRDGTLIEEAGYLDRLERLVFYPYSVDAVRALNRSGFAVVIVTNQAGIARGIFQEAFVAEAHGYISTRLAAGEAVGLRGVLVRTGYGRTEEASPGAVAPAAIVDNLVDAVSWILRES